jgi:Kef-type K+ transport system membrane component KefB
MSPILQLLLVLIIIIAAAKASGLIAARLGQPAVLGELIAGVILGPTVIDILDLRFVTDEHLGETVFQLAELGVIFLMFLAGLETDLGEVNRVRRVAILAGTLGVLVPIAAGAATGLPFGFSEKESIFIGIILAATSVSISARTLMELGVLKGRQGIAILAAAVIDDVLVLLVLSFFVAFAVESSGGAAEVIRISGGVVIFFVVSALVGLLVLPQLMRWVSRAPVSEPVLTTAVVLALAGAWFAEYTGELALITGAFLAGIFLRRTEAHRVIDEKMHGVAYGFFVPIFFVSVGLSADATNFEGDDIAVMIAIIAVAVASKLVGCGIGALLSGESLRSSIQIGSGMISRGEVGLIVASVGLSEGLIDQDLFSIMVIMVLATTLITPILLKMVFPAEPARSASF